MQICIAYVRLSSGESSVLRGSPECVSETISVAFDNGQGCEIIYQIQDEVADKYQEDALWQRFVQGIREKPLGSSAASKYEIWRWKATALWEPETPLGTSIFMLDDDDMVLQCRHAEMPKAKAN